MHFKEIKTYLQNEISRHICSIKIDLQNNLNTTLQEFASRGLVNSGLFVSNVISLHNTSVRESLGLIFKITREVALEFDVVFCDEFQSTTKLFLDNYFISLSNNGDIERYFSSIGVEHTVSNQIAQRKLELTKIEVWYRNTIPHFSFKLKNEIKKMNEKKQASTIVGLNSNIFTSNNSTINITSTISYKNNESSETLATVIEYLKNNTNLVHNQTEVLDALEDIKQEINKEKPNQFKITNLLGPALNVLCSIDKIAPAIAKLKDLLF